MAAKTRLRLNLGARLLLHTSNGDFGFPMSGMRKLNLGGFCCKMSHFRSAKGEEEEREAIRKILIHFGPLLICLLPKCVTNLHLKPVI